MKPSYSYEVLNSHTPDTHFPSPFKHLKKEEECCDILSDRVFLETISLIIIIVRRALTTQCVIKAHASNQIKTQKFCNELRLAHTVYLRLFLGIFVGRTFRFSDNFDGEASFLFRD